MSYTCKSNFSFDINDFIDLDNVLVEEELRSLGATPESRDHYNDNYRISFKNINAKETERLRHALLTPVTNDSHTPRSSLKSPTASCAESVALFKNLSKENDHVDLVTSDLKDFMGNCDMDDLLSRPGSRPMISLSPQQSYHHNSGSLTNSRLKSHNRNQQKKDQESSVAANSTLLKKLSESHPQQEKPHPTKNQEIVPSSLRHTSNGYSNSVTPTHKPTTNSRYKQSVNDSANTNKNELKTPIIEKPKNKTIQSILNKRRSIDSDGLKGLKQNEEKSSHEDILLKTKRHSMLSTGDHKSSSLKSRIPVGKATIPTTKTLAGQRYNSSMQHLSTTTHVNIQRRNSNSQEQKDRRRWSSYVSDSQKNNAVPQDQLSQREHKISPQHTSGDTNQYASMRQEPKKLSHRHSMIVPASRHMSLENSYQNIQAAGITKKKLSQEQAMHEASTPSFEKDRHPHIQSSIDENPSSGQYATRQTLIRKASLLYEQAEVLAREASLLYEQADAIEDSHFQTDIDKPVQRQHRLNRDKRTHTKTGSYQSNSPDFLQYQDHEYEYRHEQRQQPYEQAIPPSSRFNSNRANGEQRYGQLSTTSTTQQRRNRALTMPSSQQSRDEIHFYSEQPSFEPIPVRSRKHSNNSISKYTSVPPKEDRFGSSSNAYPEEIQVEASRSSGGLSNSTMSSSHSSERYYDPPTPPINAVVTHPQQSYYQYNKRRTMPIMNASMIDDQVRKTENRYSSYLTRNKKENVAPAEHEESIVSNRLFPRRRRVVSEDNGVFKQQWDQRPKPVSSLLQRQQAYSKSTEAQDVISSAKHVLSLVKQRRDRAR